MTSLNPWELQPGQAPCCGSHALGMRCCDPDDCGPCCGNCPTCPTAAKWRGILDGLEMAVTAAEYHKRANPINGDGSNSAIQAVIGSIELIVTKTPSERDELLVRYAERIEERTRQWGKL